MKSKVLRGFAAFMAAIIMFVTVSNDYTINAFAEEYVEDISGNDAVTEPVGSVEEVSNEEAIVEDIAEEPAETEPKAFFATKLVGDVLVTLEAEPGVLPEGTTMKVVEVTEDVAETVKSEIEGEDDTTVVTTVLAYDITLYDAEGNELDNASWDGKVNVSFAGTAIEEASAEADAIEISHVETDDDGLVESIELVEEVSVVDETVSVVDFDAEHFSVYTITFKTTLDWGDSITIKANLWDINDLSKTIGSKNASFNNENSQSVSDIFKVDDYKFVSAKVNGVEITALRARYSGVILHDVEKIQYCTSAGNWIDLSTNTYVDFYYTPNNYSVNCVLYDDTNNKVIDSESIEVKSEKTIANYVPSAPDGYEYNNKATLNNTNTTIYSLTFDNGVRYKTSWNGSFTSLGTNTIYFHYVKNSVDVNVNYVSGGNTIADSETKSIKKDSGWISLDTYKKTINGYEYQNATVNGTQYKYVKVKSDGKVYCSTNNNWNTSGTQINNSDTIKLNYKKIIPTSAQVKANFVCNGETIKNATQLTINKDTSATLSTVAGSITNYIFVEARINDAVNGTKIKKIGFNSTEGYAYYVKDGETKENAFNGEAVFFVYSPVTPLPEGKKYVAIFATADSGKEMDEDMANLLKVGKTAHNSVGYYPLGVITLDDSFFKDSQGRERSGALINSDNDFKKVIEAIQNIDTSMISDAYAANRGNTLAENIASIRNDQGFESGSNKTALFVWKKQEQGGSNPEYYYTDGTLTFKSDKSNAYYAHLDLRFQTYTITFKAKDNYGDVKKGDVLATRPFLSGSNTINPADSLNNFYDLVKDDYTPDKYYDEAGNEFKFNEPIEGNTTVYVSLKKIEKWNIEYKLDGGTSSSTLVYQNLTNGSDFPSIPNPTRDGFTFTGWKGENGTVYAAEDGKDTTFIHNVVTESDTFTAQWKKNKNETPIIITAASDEKTYDGTPLTNNGFTYTEGVLEGDDKLVVTVEGSATNVGDDGVNTVTSYRVMRGTTDVTDYYTFDKSVDGKLSIKPLDVTVTVVGKSDSFTYNGEPHTVNGYYSITSNNSLFDVNNVDKAKENPSASITEVGTNYMELTENDFSCDDKNFNVSFDVTAGYVTVVPATIDITVTGTQKSVKYNGQDQTAEGFAAKSNSTLFDSSKVKFVGNTNGIPSVTGNSVGKYQMNLTKDQFVYEDANVTANITVIDGYIDISMAQLIVDVVGTSNTTAIYNGEKQSVTGYDLECSDDPCGIYKEELVKFVPTTSCQAAVAEGTNADTYFMGLTSDNFSYDNHNVSVTFNVTDGYVTINKAEITINITGNNNATNVYTYNSAEQSVEGYSATPAATASFFKKSDVVYAGEAKAKGTDADTYEMGLDITKFSYSNENVVATFKLVKDGYVKIAPAPLTVITGSESRAYNGEALTSAGEISGFVGEEEVTFTVTGSQTTVGESDNTYTVLWDKTAKESNYTITEYIGKLTVTEFAGEVTATAKTDSWEYDGQSHGTTVEVTGLPNDGYYTVEKATSDATVTHVEEGKVPASVDTLVIKRDGEDVTSKLNIKKVPGKISINPKAITLKTAGTERKYDGTPLTKKELSEELGILDNETFTVEYTGSITNKGEVDNTAEIVWNGTAKSTDYDVSNDFGKLKVTPRKVVITSKSDEREYNGNALTKHEVDVTGDGFVSGEGATYTYTGSQKLVGSSENKFSYELNSNTKSENYEIETQNGTLTVKNRNAKYQITVEANSLTGITYDGQPHSVSGIVTDTFVVDGNTYTVSGLTASAVRTDAGTSPVNVTGTAVVKDSEGNDVSDQFAVSTKPGELTIGRATATVTAQNNGKTYGAEEPELKAEVTGLKNGDAASVIKYSVSRATGENVGTYTITPSGDAVQGNYNVVYEPATFTITKKTATITVNNASKIYGNADPKFTGSIGGLVDGDELEEVVYSRTNDDEGASIYEKVITATWKDNKNYEVNVIPADFTINQRHVVLTSKSADKEYDGIALTNDTVIVSGDGFAEGEGATYVVTGSQKLVGTSANTFSYKLNSNTIADNYNITTVPGTLTVKDRTEKYTITVKANSIEDKYDGTVKTAEGFETLSFTVEGNKYTVSGLTAKTEKTDAGEYPVEVTGTAVVKDAAGNVVTDQFTVSTANGTLKINKATMTVAGVDYSGAYDGQLHGAAALPSVTAGTTVSYSTDGGNTWSATVPTVKDVASVTVDVKAENKNYETATDTYTLKVTKKAVTLKSADLDKTYDGEALVNGTTALATEDGFVEGEGATYTFTGSQTNKGESANAFSYTLMDGTKAENYEIRKTEGTLTVKAVTDTVTVNVTGHTGTQVYDGKELKVTGYELEADNTLFDVSKVSYSGTAEAKTTDAAKVMMKLDTSKFSSTDANFTNVVFELVTDGYAEVTKKAVTITAKAAEKTYGANDPVFEGTVGELVNKGDLGEIIYSRKNATVNDVGTYEGVITADYTENDNYEVTVVPATFTINKAKTMTVRGTSYSAPYDGASHGEAAVPSVTEGTTVKYSVDNGTTWTTEVPTITNVGSKTVKVKATNANYEDATAEYTLEVTKKAVTITAKAAEKTYGANDPVFEGTVGELVNKGDLGEIIYSRKNATVNDAGTYEGVITADYTENDNYEVTVVPATFTINKKAVTITADNKSKVYGNNDPEFTGLVNGLVNAGDLGTVTFYRSRDLSTEDAGIYEKSILVRFTENPNYNVTVTPGNFEITKRPVTLISESADKEYDGTALTNDTVTIGGDGFANGEGATFVVTGSQKLVGTSENAFTYTLNDNTYAKNYDITTEFGTLTVKSRNAKFNITVEAQSGTFDYDGTNKTVSGLMTNNFLVDGNKYTVSGYTVSNTQRNAGTYAVNVIGTPVVTDAEGNDVSSEFAVSVKNGTMVINKRNARIVADNASKYDGEWENGFTGTVTGVVAGDDLQVTYSREEGYAPGQYAIIPSYVANNNYIVEVVNGVFTIYANEEPNGPGNNPGNNPNPQPTPGGNTPAPGPAPLPGPQVVEEQPVEETPVVVEEEETPLTPSIQETEIEAEKVPLAPTTEIGEEEVPLAMIDHCLIHWIILLITLIDALYASLRLVAMKKENEEENKTAEN